MAHASSEGYALNILARLATNTKWSSISNERLKEVLNTSPTILGERFAEFLERHAVPRKIIAHTDTIMVPAVNSFSLLGSFYWQPGTATEVVISHVDHTFQATSPRISTRRRWGLRRLL